MVPRWTLEIPASRRPELWRSLKSEVMANNRRSLGIFLGWVFWTRASTTRFMKIGIIGGTGKEGRGIGVRWAKAGHEVRLGSRDAARGQASADELAAKYGVELTGGSNSEAISSAQVVLLSVPYGAHRDTLTALAGELAGKVLIDITVPLKPPKVREVHLPEGTSAALEAQALLPDTIVVASLHHVSSAHLADLDHRIDCDVLVCSNDADARTTTVKLLDDLGVRGIDAGSLKNAVALEALTPVLLHINKHYKGPGAGIRITGLPQD